MGYIHLLTDQIIAGIFYFAISLIASAVILHRHRTKIVLAMVFILGGLAILGLNTYATFIEPTKLEVRNEIIDLEDYTGEPFKIVLMSDTHVGRYNNSARLERAIAEIKKIDDADYVFILGDFVNGENSDLSQLDPIIDISSEKWVYGIYGNHDYTKTDRDHDTFEIIGPLEEKLEKLRISMLHNSAIWIGEPQHQIIIGGVGDTWADDQDFSFLDLVSEESTCIILSHNPDAVLTLAENETYPKKVDLVISGHTHGGEVRIPYLGALARIPTELPQSYDQGFKTYDDMKMYITSGLGSIGTRMRFDNPPEVILLTIQ